MNFDGINITTDYGNGPNGIKAFGNVSSVVRNATGDYTINFTSQLPDAYYSVACFTEGGAISDGSGTYCSPVDVTTPRTVQAIRITTRSDQGTKTNIAFSLAIIR